MMTIQKQQLEKILKKTHEMNGKNWSFISLKIDKFS